MALHRSPKPQIGVRFPGGVPSIKVLCGISLGAKQQISNLRSSVRFRYPAPSFKVVYYVPSKQTRCRRRTVNPLSLVRFQGSEHSTLWGCSANGNTSGLQPEIESSILSRSTKFIAGCNRYRSVS